MSEIHLNQSISYLSTKGKKPKLKKLTNLAAFNDYTKTIDDVYENMEVYNPT